MQHFVLGVLILQYRKWRLKLQIITQVRQIVKEQRRR